MQEVISQLKYDIQNIELKLNAIKKAKKEMLSLKGKPAYDTRQSALDNWQNEIQEHKKTIDIYYLKLNQSF
jgi:hypothetical protein|tara:strand:+ start:87 stop:299 length:213 start_codon:yes stop_codon:yes gene_type:complete